MTSHLKKVELHCHLEGAAPPALTAAQAQKYGVDISAELRDGAYVWHDFASFLECYDKVSEVYRTEEDYALLTETYLDELAGIHTIYSELIVSPDHGKRIGLGADPYIAGICEGIRRAREKSGIEARLIVTGERHFGPESVIGAAEYAAKAGNPLITGFNLAGEERMGRVADYARAFDIARDAGLGLTIHAGEVCGAFSVADALDAVRPSRIGHGVRAIEDLDLVKRLADLGTVLEICPGSNIALGVFPDFASHPLRRLKEAGVGVTISSDDPPFFHTSLKQEYEFAAGVFGFSDAEIDAMTRTAIEAAFVDEQTRKVLLARL
ncbi:adenosine deaminase [Rhizobium leguminosarum]|uniref:Adenine deaminase n=1 Tax=Rhizobium leguminosarum TaxID=384 RepID=A0A6P0DE93_RHILE|nr:adenosine deaminase [Rhizobium leguminosarum]ASS54910.1 adenosine deaminase [Rhizobium leguminosarum bv. viciae]AVC52330.1 adenosine deaminase [Rhizobium leguminosarum bv. viciae]MBB4327938.1 adenosine deaminase [Rhizobium leguminosarum]MBB4341911.1 adenosine deaminase [Rhizobium leguminosarum]MBB4353603.1 adenosine deaminase [Rhizobium leguminosarum]